MTLFTTDHAENMRNASDPSRIVIPVSLGHNRDPNGRWPNRGRQDVSRYSPAVIPEGPMRDFWLATTPLNRDIANGRATQGGDIVQSRNGRKAMQESIEQYMDPEKIHDHLSRVADELQSSNDSAKRIGMACYEDLSNDKNFCHRRMIAERLSKKIGVPIPDISHLKIFQKEKGQENENPLQFYETTILDPMRAIAAREGLDLAKDKDALAKIFEKKLPDLGRLNAIIKHWDSQREEPLPDAIAPGASPQITDQINNSMDTSIQHDYPHANITAKSWKSIFSNFSPRKIIYTDDAGEQLIAPSSESLYQAMKLKPNSETGGLSDQAKLIAGMTPRDAKNASRLLYQRNPDVFFSPAEFELKKIELMKTVLQLKAKQHPEFLDALLATGNEQIVESTGTRDAYWGVIDTPSGQKGRNVQGKLLMQIRDEIRGNQQSAPDAPAASPEVKEGIKGDITNPDFQKSGGYNMIVNTCNTVFNPYDRNAAPVMGAGIAKMFRDKYKHTDYMDAVANYLHPRNMTVAAAQRAFGASWRPVDPAPGSVFVHQPTIVDPQTGEVGETPFGPHIASLFVKRHYRDQARRDDTNGAITELKAYLDNNPSPDGKPWKVAMPHISGLNGERGNRVEGSKSVGETGGWPATRQHIIDTFKDSGHEVHIIDFPAGVDGGQQGATPAVSSTMDPVMPFDQRSGVTSIRKTMSHASVQDRAFQRVLNETDWQKQFFDSVNAGKYSAYLDGLRAGNGYTPEQIAAISLKIRQANVDGLKDRRDTKHLYSGARIADDGSTVLFDNADTMKLLQASEPTLKRVMVSNHGIYLESEQPKRTTLQPVRKNFQYNHYQDGDGRKLYEQTKRVNYAEYEPGLWYSDIGSYSPGKPAK